MKTIRIIDKGTIEYSQAWEFQKSLFEPRLGGEEGEDCLVYCEHPHVYTLGKSGHQNNLLVDESFLKTINATFFKIDRGGDITYHGYGQLVGYPILNLAHFDLGLKTYIHLLEEAVIQTIKTYDIEGYRSEGATGVWVREGARESKICAIGVKASRFITMHGFALNVNTDLRYFEYINPCGFVDRGVTSIEKIRGEKIEMEQVKERFKTAFLALLQAK